MTRKQQIEQAEIDFADNMIAVRPNTIVAVADYDAGLRAGFMEGAQWADKTMIDKAVEWMKDHLTLYISMECKGWEKEELIIEKEKLINDFRKAMEE